jgi:hypothetical protein
MQTGVSWSLNVMPSDTEHGGIERKSGSMGWSGGRVRLRVFVDKVQYLSKGRMRKSGWLAGT